MLKLKKTVIFAVLLPILVSAMASLDTLEISPCDEAVVTIFGDLICLSANRGDIVVYSNFNPTATYGRSNTEKQILLNPAGLSLDEPGSILVLERDSRQILSFDRFLNCRKVLPLPDEIIFPRDFTVTSEHEWLLTDDFNDRIYRFTPESNRVSIWGSGYTAGPANLIRHREAVYVFLKEEKRLRRMSAYGILQKEFFIPDTIPTQFVFPLNNKLFALSGSKGVWLWQPEKNAIQISNLDKVIHVSQTDDLIIMIARDGTVLLRQ